VWTSANNQLSIRVARREQQLYLFIKVADSELVYHKIPLFRPDAGEDKLPDRWEQLVNGDSVEIAVEKIDRSIVGGYNYVCCVASHFSIEFFHD
jgi:hypothetical protein